MNQCVPSWDIEENQALLPHPLSSKPQSKTNYSFPLHISTSDYEVTELTWKNGHLGMHGFGVPKHLPDKTKEINIYSAASAPATICSWEKPLAGGTLESLVNQSAYIPSFSLPVTGTVGSSNTLMGSSSVTPTLTEEGNEGRVARLIHDWSNRNEESISDSATRGGESRQASHDTCDKEICNTGFTVSTSLVSPRNNSSAMDCTTNSVCHTKNQRRRGGAEEKKKQTAKLSLGKRSRCAAVHNQSERKRRDKINQRMRILQKMVPNSSKTDKASMLDEVIEYMKQLQAKVEMMNRMNMPSMMLPLPLQQQLQMSAMAQMRMGMNMGMGLGVMDLNTMAQSGMPPHLLYHNPFMSMASWGDMSHSTSSMHAEPMNASFLASQSQPMTMDAYSRMAAMYQQFQALASAPTTPHL